MTLAAPIATDVARLEIDGTTYELPIIEGTEGERAIDISGLRSTSGVITLDLGYARDVRRHVVCPRFARRNDFDWYSRCFYSIFHVQSHLDEASAFDQSGLLVRLTRKRLVAHDPLERHAG